ncbi:hypothetical protein NPIL_558831 [Nephila pilipes]|uniref:Uncharacterized protein n=1 Tax=Nephila pilipes TaxID=299642 RepID=A0A8X6QJ13_NEPPI|nr:hypothetical protein NPIL_558831 [Nephila pilipes]
MRLKGYRTISNGQNQPDLLRSELRRAKPHRQQPSGRDSPPHGGRYLFVCAPQLQWRETYTTKSLTTMSKSRGGQRSAPGTCILHWVLRASRRALLLGRPSWHISLRMQRAQRCPSAPALSLLRPGSAKGDAGSNSWDYLSMLLDLGNPSDVVGFSRCRLIFKNLRILFMQFTYTYC